MTTCNAPRGGIASAHPTSKQGRPADRQPSAFMRSALASAIVALMASSVPFDAIAYSDIERIEPTYTYWLPTGPSGIPYPSPEAALAAYQASQPAPPSPYYQLSNVRPSPFTRFVNGRPSDWYWDYVVVHPAAPAADYSGTTGSIWLQTSCSPEWYPQTESLPDGSQKTWCERAVQRPAEPPMCSRTSDGETTPNPINAATREKYRDELDLLDAGPSALSWRRLYRSSWGQDPLKQATSAMGLAWAHNHSTFLKYTAPIGANAPLSTGGGASPIPANALIVSPDGHVRAFTQNVGSSLWTSSSLTDNGAVAWCVRVQMRDANRPSRHAPFELRSATANFSGVLATSTRPGPPFSS